MIVKAQDGTEYDIYDFCTEGKCVYCRDNKDRRRKRLLGVYETKARAVEVFNQIRRCVDGYFEML